MEGGLVKRLESAVSRLEVLAAGSPAPAPTTSRDFSGTLPSDPAISALDELVAGSIGSLRTAAEQIGGNVLEATAILEEAFDVQKDLLIKAKQHQKPEPADLAEFLKPLNEVILKAIALTEGKRPDFFNHLKAAADSLSALAWIAYSGKECGMSLPIAHVEESWQMAEFYSNKILVECKNNPVHADWAKALKDLYLPGLRDLVKRFYPLGPVWGPAGSPSLSASMSPPGKAPVPPSPPPASLLTSEVASSHPKEGSRGMSAVFQEISSGKPVTAGLRKVTDDMKTKNRADRTGVVGATEKGVHSSSFSASKVVPPILELQMGRKWAVENQIGAKSLTIDDCDTKQSVYVFGCKDSVLQVKGKVNNITIDKCHKTGILFKGVVAACEIVNCNGVEVQCEGSAPTISIDNTTGCQLYLSKDSLESSITTAKSIDINVLVPSASPGGDWAKHASADVHSIVDSLLDTWVSSSFPANKYLVRLLEHIFIRLKCRTQVNYLARSLASEGESITDVDENQGPRSSIPSKAEHALPQQFIHTFKDGQFVTSPVSHSGG